ncbi:zinc-ribbon domain-containing protein [uncultured Endozoicomonas sp.]|uniref:zinc-ribbon domain-containing protein n=1 Tax=uncultured Endozoicomonas sp. TaxID=432652 RepID=UPI002636CE0E|nr:zinc-ribbon domain-containing protein [uncultured Endozoicomonas sp.]
MAQERSTHKSVIKAPASLEHARSVIKSDPILSKEYCDKLNGQLNDLRVRMKDKIYWKCPIPQHEPFPAPTKDRRSKGDCAGSRCPLCAAISYSPIQASITECLRYLLRVHRYTVLSREKVMGHEADIYIPDLCCIIEVDGHPFHDRADKIEKDLTKSNAWYDQYRVIRLRDDRLQSDASPHDIVCVDRVEINNLESCCLSVIRAMQKGLEINDQRLNELLESITKKGFAEGELAQFYYTQPSPPAGNSLADKHPNLARYWSPFNSLGPEHFYPASNMMANWLCPLCGDDYPQQIAQRVKVDNRTGLPRLTHRECCQKIRYAANADEIRAWILKPRGGATLPKALRNRMK